MLKNYFLAVDIGNTRTKLSFAEKGKRGVTYVFQSFTQLESLLAEFKPVAIILSNVKGDDEMVAFLNKTGVKIYELSAKLKFPFLISYDTPDTLGADRLANVRGVFGAGEINNASFLIIDSGTCIKYDYLIKGTYVGGNIAPGIEMRAKAMQHFTGKLPLVNVDAGVVNSIGKNTQEALKNGVLLGVQAELDAYINRFLEQYPTGKIVITGGNLDVFEFDSKNVIFADPEITLRGLHYILQENLS